MALALDDALNPPPAGVPAGQSSGALSGYFSAAGISPMQARSGGSPSDAEDEEDDSNPYIALTWFTRRMMTGDSTPRGFGVESMKVRDTQGKTLNKLQRELEEADLPFQKQMAFLLTLAGFGIPSGPGTTVQESWDYAKSMTLAELMEAHGELLKATANQQAIGKKITPDQMLANAIRFRLPYRLKWDGDLSTLLPTLATEAKGILGQELKDTAAGKEAKAEEQPFTGVIKRTQITTDVMDPTDARALVRALLMQELGREPTEEEFEDFTSAALNAQRRNPTKTVTKQHYEEGMLEKTETERERGIGMAGIQDRLTERARRDPDWAEWQAIGTYAPALFSALGSTVPGV